jgi:3-hydroxyisobutyrate dehydrogenase-like beta-hydroxyacid dehydrogenase
MTERTDSTHDVSVIGLGSMGSAIARTFIDAGCRVAVWNRSRDKIDALVSGGATPCDGPADAFEASRHVVVCLAGYSVWRSVIEDHGLQSHLGGTCLIQLTGGMIDEVREHASFIESHDGRLVDGALMCFPGQLGTNEASLLVAGESDVIDDCDSFLSRLAPTWTNLGDDITRPAVLSRALTAGILTSLVGLVNGIAICRSGGISLDTYLDHVEKSDAIVPAEKRRLIEAVRDGDTEDTQASVKVWEEAHQTIHAVAETLGTNLVLQDALKAVFQEGERMGLGDHDLSALSDVFSSPPSV